MAERTTVERSWGMVRTLHFDQWFRGLDAERGTQVTAALRRVTRVGPVLGRPRVLQALDAEERATLWQLLARALRGAEPARAEACDQVLAPELA